MSTPPSLEPIMRLGFLGSIHRSWLSPWCSPLTSLKVTPPSRETYSPLPGPPEVNSLVRRRHCHSPAKRARGLLGSRQTSLAPVSASLNSTCCQVLPPSVVR